MPQNIYAHQARLNPKKTTKLFQVEDIAPANMSGTKEMDSGRYELLDHSASRLSIPASELQCSEPTAVMLATT